MLPLQGFLFHPAKTSQISRIHLETGLLDDSRLPSLPIRIILATVTGFTELPIFDPMEAQMFGKVEGANG